MSRIGELKKTLIEKIRNTNNEELLKKIARLFELEEELDEIYVMSSGEAEAVEDGLQQLKNGQRISHEEVKRQVDEWLKEPIKT
jgi:hypothetical protein